MTLATDILTLLNHTSHTLRHLTSLLPAEHTAAALRQLVVTAEAAAKLAEVAHVEVLTAQGAGAAAGEKGAPEEMVRVEAERVKNETERLKAEAWKVGREAERAIAETERLKAQAMMVRSEKMRIDAETERLRAETEGNRAETEGKKAEAQKVGKEAERAVAETERLKTEAMVVRSEKIMVDAETETERVDAAAEGKKVETEGKKVVAEVVVGKHLQVPAPEKAGEQQKLGLGLETVRGGEVASDAEKEREKPETEGKKAEVETVRGDEVARAQKSARIFFSGFQQTVKAKTEPTKIEAEKAATEEVDWLVALQPRARAEDRRSGKKCWREWFPARVTAEDAQGRQWTGLLARGKAEAEAERDKAREEAGKLKRGPNDGGIQAWVTDGL